MELFAITLPGLEPVLAAEARSLGFKVTHINAGGVSIEGDWEDVARANISLRGATRILARLTNFPAMHLSQLDKRARKLPWETWFRPDVPIRVEATSRKSKIYHQRAAAERIENALRDTLGVTISKDATLTVKLRIEDNLCTLSVDTSGEPLHKRGHKLQVNKAPMRETLAALFLGASSYNGQMPIYDPMCGSGTFPIEAAEIAAGLLPGRHRSFGYEQLAGFAATDQGNHPAPRATDLHFFGSDRDTGAITMSQKNAERAGVAHLTTFRHQAISDATPPCDTPGLVIINPPYGGRVGNKKPLYGLYAAFGTVMKERFKGWRIAMITSESGLAKTSGLPWQPPGPLVDHGGIKIRLWQTQL